MAYYPFATETGAIYKLVAPNGVTAVFNDPLDANYVGALTEVTGLDSADVREAADDLTQADGGTHGDFFLGRRPIVLSGRVFNFGTIKQRNLRLDLADRASMALRGDSTLAWKPSSRVENIVGNPRAVVDTAGWATTTGNALLTTGATLTRLTAQTPPVGTTAFQIVTTASANQGAAFAFQAVAGVTYKISVAAKRSSGTAAGELAIWNGSVTQLAAGINTTTWTTYTATFTATATGTAYLAIRDPTTTASTFQFSDVMIATGGPSGYVDGDTAGYFWQGDVGVSPSGDFIEMFTTVRRQQPFRQTGAYIKEFQISLVSEYAALYSTGLKTASGTAGTNVVVENRGSWPSYPILRVTGPTSVTNPTATNSTTGAVLRTTGSLLVAAGETLEIDTLNRTAKFIAGARNGQSANRFLDYGGTVWPALLTGNNTLTLNGTTGTLTVVFRDAWA